jgi:hypothetical protein
LFFHSLGRKAVTLHVSQTVEAAYSPTNNKIRRPTGSLPCGEPLKRPHDGRTLLTDSIDPYRATDPSMSFRSSTPMIVPQCLP